MTTTRGPGRPRDEGARQKILEAALALVSDEGLAAATIEAIAAAAGVGKQTLYRWWPSRAEILLEALRDHAASVISEPDTGSFRHDLEQFVEASMKAARRRRAGAPLLTALMAEAQLDDGFRKRFRDDFIAVRRAALARLFERARKRGELREGFVVDLGVDLVFGPMWYRLLVGHLPTDDAFARDLAAAVVAAAT